MMRMMRGAGGRPIVLTISTNQAALYDIKVAAGNPPDRVSITVILDAGIVLQAGLETNASGSFIAGSTIKFINNGSVCGLGGAGGTGDSISNASTVTGAGNGVGGSQAISMHWPMTIDNTNGNIFGGGGGGGGGGMGADVTVGTWSKNNAGPGGGGGGGQGYNNASGGARGTNYDGDTASPSAVGSNGTSGGGGSGGQGGVLPSLTKGGTGGTGGTWGMNGSNGDQGRDYLGGNPASYDIGQSGGASGNSITKNGFALTWLGGNNGTQVKGPQV